VEGPYTPAVVQQSGVQLRLCSPAGSEDSVPRRGPSLTRIQASPLKSNTPAAGVAAKPKFRISMESSRREDTLPVITQPVVFVGTVQDFVVDEDGKRTEKKSDKSSAESVKP